MPHTVQMTVQHFGVGVTPPIVTCQDCDWTVSGWSVDVWHAMQDHVDPQPQ